MRKAVPTDGDSFVERPQWAPPFRSGWFQTSLSVVIGILLCAVCAPPASGGTALRAPNESVSRSAKVSLLVRADRRGPCTLASTRHSRLTTKAVFRSTKGDNRVTFRVAARAPAGKWRLTVRCRKTRARTTIRVRGRGGRGSLFSPRTLSSARLDHGALDPRVIPRSVEDPGKDQGGPDPDLRMPFPCGETWDASSYPGHGRAIDWNAPGGDRGRPVVASADGVAFPQPLGQFNGGFGNYIIVNHGAGWTTLYAHLLGYAVRPGQTVQQGQRIGYVGNTGRSFGDHLHYEQRVNRARVFVRFSIGRLRLGRQRSDNCAPSPPPPPPPPPGIGLALTVDNRVTNGPTQMREDVPAYLSTRPANYCKRDGCSLPGTERNSGGTYAPAVCTTIAVRTTNGHDGESNDDRNPGLFSSTRWYGIRLNGSIAFISEVWINASQRGGLGLPNC